MLNKDRIKEAESNVKIYLIDGLIKKVKSDKEIEKLLLNNSRESLSVASILIEKELSALWVIVCAYYSMYYIAKAVLYSNGFKIGEKISHKVTSDSLIVYVKKILEKELIKDFETAQEEALELAGVKAEEMVYSFDRELEKRSRFQYSLTENAMQNKAKTSFERAKKFVLVMEKLL
ncbi:hypothetical protein COV11_04940 [Candidatus Woesearchaeota archaeon CG10_big_fil_rev_8_21_14_0_10_30_7]|nr:MAG: hypothetical protein COV11_04940 [Candidatus Woesearchaeota archaeon CG10_big_fil_rev_8_21_14_0_10_30_7]